MVENLLLIDTSLEKGLVAWMRGQEALFHAPLQGRECAQEVTAVLEQQLREHGLSMPELSAVGVAIGPGSYTGLRLGVITAEAFAYALQIPIIGVPSAEAYAPRLPVEQQAFAVVFDARMGGVYVTLATSRDGAVSYGEPQVCALDKLPEILKNTALVVSPHVAQLQARLGPEAAGLSPERWQDIAPCPYQLAEACQRRPRTTTTVAANILYLRLPQIGGTAPP